MKKVILILLSLTMLLSANACSSNIKSNEGTSQEIVQPSEQIKLTNKMTENELAKVDKHGLTLLDAPEKPANSEDKSEQTAHTVSVEFAASEEGANTEPKFILVDGYIMPDQIPNADPDYDGGAFDFEFGYFDDDGEIVDETKSFTDFAEYLEWIRKWDAENGYSDDEIEQDILRIQIANEALKTGDYETLPEGSVDVTDSSLHYVFSDTSADYRDVWEYDRDAVEAIRDSIDEINIYDEEMNTDFLVHVTLPPDYDKDRTYPVFFLTDGVWRFGNHTELRKVMEDGEAAPVILVSLGYQYQIDGTDGNLRYDNLVIERDKLLDFITDNLMPYLGENYSIDYASSTLYGHSDGGVFTHNALFKSDLYDNQPFGNYIIGSPALWGLYNYNDRLGISSDEVLNDYGYFDRNKTLNKSVFLCAGELEDPDYADSYNGHDTTLEGVAKLKERLETHGVNLTYKLYDSHHYQFIPEMLIEFLKEKYPC